MIELSGLRKFFVHGVMILKEKLLVCQASALTITGDIKNLDPSESENPKIVLQANLKVINERLGHYSTSNVSSSFRRHS